MPGSVAILLDHGDRNQWWCSRRSRWIYSAPWNIYMRSVSCTELPATSFDALSRRG